MIFQLLQESCKISIVSTRFVIICEKRMSIRTILHLLVVRDLRKTCLSINIANKIRYVRTKRVRVKNSNNFFYLKLFIVNIIRFDLQIYLIFVTVQKIIVTKREIWENFQKNSDSND